MARQGDNFRSALKQHKRWANAASIISVVLVIGLLCFTDYLADTLNADGPSRIGSYIAIVGVVSVVCIWQAAAVTVARIEKMVKDHDRKRSWE